MTEEIRDIIGILANTAKMLNDKEAISNLDDAVNELRRLEVAAAAHQARYTEQKQAFERLRRVVGNAATEAITVSDRIEGKYRRTIG
jgi:hypothetical protein